MSTRPRTVAGANGRARPLVLVVDDDAAIRESFGLILEDGHDVLFAEDGHAALASIDAHHVDVVLLDILMPGIDGIEVLKQLRALRPELPVIVVTAVKTVESAVIAMKLGAVDYITKPFDEDRLLAVVRHASRRRPERVPPPATAATPHRPEPPPRLLLVGSDIGRLACLAVALRRFGPLEILGSTGEVRSRLASFKPTSIIVDCLRRTPELLEALAGAPDARVHRRIVVTAASSDPRLAARWTERGVTVPTSRVGLATIVGRVADQHHDRTGGSPARPRVGVHVGRAMEYVSQHYGDDLSLAALSTVVGVSEGHLTRSFHSEIGVPFHAFVTEVRVTVAQHFLAATDMKLEAIARCAGFCDAAHLTRVFRAHGLGRPGRLRHPHPPIPQR